jgi:iron complex outermembrane receptor protein
MRASLVAAIVASIVAFSASTSAQAAIKQPTAIPPQELAPALRTLVGEREFQMVYSSELLIDRRTQGASGDLTMSEALTQLLSGTGLTYRYVDDKTVSIVPVSAQPPQKGTSRPDPEAEHTKQPAGGDGIQKKSFWDRFRVAQVDQAPAASAGAVAAAGAPYEKKEGDKLEEITVTAQKREERLQDVPMTITALSGESLARSGIDNTRDLGVATPGLVIAESGTVSVTLRGVASILQGVTTDPSTAVYVDGVYQPRFESALLELMDIKRVEVLKGPQVVLYGRNATAGSIHFISNEPEDDFGGGARLTFGNFNYTHSSAVLNVPIVSNRLLMRVSAMQVKSDGYTTNTLNPSDRPSRTDIRSGKFTFKYLPTEGLDITLRGYVDDDRAITSGLKVLDPAALGSAYPLADPRKVTSDQPSSQPYKNHGTSLNIGWDLSWAKLTSIAAYAKSSFGPLNYDADTTENSIVSVGVRGQPGLGLFQDSELWSEELYLAGTHGGLNWLVGAVYMQEDARYGGADEFGPGNIFYFPATNEIEAMAAYGQVAYSVTDALQFTAGLRYSDESKNVGRTIGSPTPAPLQHDRKSWSAWTPSFTASYHVTPDEMVYATVSKGFKSGGFNSADFGPLGPALDPEKITNYEVGAKTGWFEDRLRLDVSAFKYKFTDLQIQTFAPPFLSIWENAGSATGKGLELTAHATPYERFQLDAGLSMLDAEYETFISGGTGSPVSFAGNRPPQSPTMTLSLGTSYVAPLGSLGSATMRMDYYHSARRYFSSANDEMLSQKPYDLLNARITFNPSRSGAWFSAYAKNITNEVVYASGFALGTTVVVAPAAPRTYGVELGYEF